MAMQYTKEEVLQAIREELISSYDSLSNGDLPYTVMGVVHKAFERIEPLVEDIKCFRCESSCAGMPEDMCINCHQKDLM